MTVLCKQMRSATVAKPSITRARGVGLRGMRSWLIAALLLVSAAGARAGELSSWAWTGTYNNVAMAGNAVFSVVQAGAGWKLVVDLGNTAAANPKAPAEVLTGLYFNVTGQSGALTLASAVATGGLFKTTGQTVAAAGTANTNICAPGKGGTAPASACSVLQAGGWEAGYNVSGLKSATAEHWGIGTAGLGAFQSAAADAGNSNYGLAPSHGDGTGTALAKQVPFVDGNAVYELSGLSSNLVAVTNVVAVYGTGPSVVLAANFTGPFVVIPEPPGAALLVLGLVGLVRVRRRG